MNVFDVLREKLEEAKSDWNNDYNVPISNAIKIVNQVEQEYNNGWIPCSEKLPPQPKTNPEFEGKPLELYLVSMNDSEYPWRAFWNGKDFTDGWRVVYPTAWQPLPPKYEPKGE